MGLDQKDMIEQAKAAALADVKEKLARLEEIESQLTALQAEHKKISGERDTLADENQRQLSRTNQLLEEKDDVRQKLLEREEEVSDSGRQNGRQTFCWRREQVHNGFLLYICVCVVLTLAHLSFNPLAEENYGEMHGVQRSVASGLSFCHFRSFVRSHDGGLSRVFPVLVRKIRKG